MYELLHSICASSLTLLTIVVGCSDPSVAVLTCAAKNAAQSQTKHPTTESWVQIPTQIYQADFGKEQCWAAFGEELALAISPMGWAKPIVSEAC